MHVADRRFATSVTATSVTAGNSSGTFAFTVTPNAGAAQSVTLNVNGHQFTGPQFLITQAGISQAQPVSVTPPSGTAGRQIFYFQAQNASGAAGIQYTQFLFSKSGINAGNACYISYDPVGDVFYLLSDDMTQWYGLLGGSGNTIGNAQCEIHGASSGSVASGTTLTVAADISFRTGFAGAKTIYQFAGDTLGDGSGWVSEGSWNDTGDANIVEINSLSPLPGSGLRQLSPPRLAMEAEAVQSHSLSS